MVRLIADGGAIFRKKPLGLGLLRFIIRSGGAGAPSISAFSVGPQSGTDLPALITLTEGITAPTALYIVGVDAGSGTPSAAQIIAGQDSLGAAADFVASIADVATGTEVISITPPASGDYDFYAVAVDAGALQSNVVSSLVVAFAVYNPSTDLAGYDYSIDPSVIGTLFTDTAGTVPVTAPGDLVACVRDPFTNDIVATQTTSGNRPIYQVDGSGKAYLQGWDGTTVRWLVGTSKTYNTDSKNRALVVAAVQQGARGSANALVVAQGGGSSPRFGIMAPNAFNNHSFIHRGSIGGSATVTFPTETLPLKMVLSLYGSIPGDLTVARRDGAEVGRTTIDQGTGFYPNGSPGIGAYSGGTDPFRGNIYYLLVAVSSTTDYTDADISPAESYAAARLN